MKRLRLFCSDLDGTLLTPPAGLVSREALRFLKELRSRTRFAYVTGRHLELADDGINHAGLPCPDFLVCDVGTTVFQAANGRWVRDEAYRNLMRRRLGDADPAEIRTRVGELPALRLQEDDRQTEFKVSFYFSPQAGEDAVQRDVIRVLDQIGAHADLIVSTNPAGDVGLLDIVPTGGSKAGAVDHLRRMLELSRDDVLFAGDSGNDVDALLAGTLGVLVGNAPDSVRERVRAEASARGLEARVVLVTERHAKGVMEGVRRLAFHRSS